MNPVILIGCFTPLAIILILTRLIVWVNSINSESAYSRNPYADVNEKDEEYGDRTDYRG